MSNVFEMERWIEAKRASAERFPVAEPELPLQFGGGGGTSPDMDTVDAKIAAAEARTDTKFAELRGYLKDFATAKEMRNAVWGAAATVLGVLLAILAFGGDRFDGGISVGGIISKVQDEQKARDQAQDAKLDEILKRLPPPKG